MWIRDWMKVILGQVLVIQDSMMAVVREIDWEGERDERGQEVGVDSCWGWVSA